MCVLTPCCADQCTPVQRQHNQYVAHAPYADLRVRARAGLAHGKVHGARTQQLRTLGVCHYVLTNAYTHARPSREKNGPRVQALQAAPTVTRLAATEPLLTAYQAREACRPLTALQAHLSWTCLCLFCKPLLRGCSHCIPEEGRDVIGAAVAQAHLLAREREWTTGQCAGACGLQPPRAEAALTCLWA